jgi:TPR repeat protein
MSTMPVANAGTPSTSVLRRSKERARSSPSSVVAQDYVRAHMWYNLSASNGNAEAVIDRDELAKKMSAAQIAEAQKLAREWKPVGALVIEPEVAL